jgi:hypothetical protein
MQTWHVWGDFVHTRPGRIGKAQIVTGGDEAARRAAESAGFDLERRTRNGFEPWTATFRAETDDNQDFAFASAPTVRGWCRA